MKPFATTFLLLLAVSLSCALIHDLKIQNDNRRRFFIENFGFEAHGEIHMDIYNFKIGGRRYTDAYIDQVGFVIKRSDTDSTAFVEDTTAGDVDCRELLKQQDGKTLIISIEGNGNHTSLSHTVNEGEEGFYNTYFVNCAGQGVSFELKLVQFNIDSNGNRNYLSAGYTPTPTLYGIFTAAYVVALFAWIYNLKKGTKRNRVHYLMTGLLILKILSLFFQTMELHFIKTTGSAEGWDIVYYIFTLLKGVMLFVVIALIGTGWSFIKPYLSVREKKIFLIVIPLQLLDNIALIIVEDTAPGSQDWETWKDIFRLVDIICCGAILIPIIWSIKHLREASQIDGKAAHNLKQLQIFRQFYLMVVSYIYFTRIIVYLVDATLPFRLVWLGDLFSEAATLLFFLAVGYKFGAIDYDAEYSQLDEEDANSIKLEQYT